MDDLDRVQELVDLRTERSISSARSLLNQGGEIECVDCGVEIPAARRNAYRAARRCALCQTRLETRQR